eukprot:scaffold577_cov405-Prasinococcus_capsulatus_cf.AAC.20
MGSCALRSRGRARVCFLAALAHIWAGAPAPSHFAGTVREWAWDAASRMVLGRGLTSTRTPA